MPDWIIHVEGRGSTHSGKHGDANNALVALVAFLQEHGHAVTQARFTSDRPEENMLDPVMMDLHVQLVEQAAAAEIMREGSGSDDTESSPEMPPVPAMGESHPGMNPPGINVENPPSGSGISNAR